jgi:hypothetical protein
LLWASVLAKSVIRVHYIHVVLAKFPLFDSSGMETLPRQKRWCSGPTKFMTYKMSSTCESGETICLLGFLLKWNQPRCQRHECPRDEKDPRPPRTS